MAKQPNILIVMVDQLTPFMLGCHGNPAARTPQIDRLAAEGLRFDAAYCNSPLCTPGRYAFMTGQHVSRFGGYDNAAYLPSTLPTFAHYLRLMGYRTALSGKMHFVGPDQLHGFEERYTTDVYPADFGWVPDWRNPDERIDLWYHNMSSVVQSGVVAVTNQLSYDEEVGWAARRALYDYARDSDERPFCLVASFIHPHDPYAAQQRYWDLYRDVEIPLPRVARPAAAANDAHSLRLEKAIALDAVDIGEEDIVRARRAYLANVSYVDDWLGQLRDTLAETGMAGNTVVLFLSDHGDMLGERGLWYKMSPFEWSVRIPMILQVPGGSAGAVVGAPVSQVDVLPTLLGLASAEGSVDQPEIIDPLAGRDLLAVAAGAKSTAVSEYLAEATGQPQLMLREDGWKYVCCPGDPELLFDLQNDPDEIRNRAEDPSAAARLAAFRTWAKEHWDVEAVRAAVLESQKRRRVLSGALRLGRYQGWDWQPPRDAQNEYTRSHLELTEFDITSRWPRPPRFEPRWK
jgi:choline-sulfatase